MSKFGNGIPAGMIGICAQCRNKAEIALYDGDNPDPICESCHHENAKLEKFIANKNGNASQTFRQDQHSISKSQPQSYDSERERYIEIITSGADNKWVDSFIKEIVLKNVIKYDWKQVIRSERWFSVLDLRRFALDVNPGFESESKFTTETSNEIPLAKVTVTRRTRRNNKGASHVKPVSISN